MNLNLYIKLKNIRRNIIVNKNLQLLSYVYLVLSVFHVPFADLVIPVLVAAVTPLAAVAAAVVEHAVPTGNVVPTPRLPLLPSLVVVHVPSEASHALPSLSVVYGGFLFHVMFFPETHN